MVEEGKKEGKEEETQPPEVPEVAIEKGQVSPEQLEEIETGDYSTAGQIASKLRYTHAYILDLINADRIKGIKPFGGQWRVPKSEVERLIKEGIPPLPREKKQAPVTELQVDEKKVKSRVIEPEKKEKKPSPLFDLDFLGIFPKEKK